MRWVRSVSLRLQIILLVLSFTLAIGLGNTLRTRMALNDLGRAQFTRRSVATARALAELATGPLITNDLFGLYELINDTLLNDPDVRYVLVIDARGDVCAHTFGSGVPRGLIAANGVPPGERWHTRRLRTEEGYILDVAVPLMGGEAGMLRLGMSENALTADVQRHTLYLLALTALSLLPVLALTYLLGQALTRPLLELVEVVEATGKGDLSRRAPVAGRDEVAQLGAAFNRMTEELAFSQEALETSNRALQERNEELAALYEIATATAHVSSVDTLVSAALDKALDLMALQVGWVFLEDERSGGNWAVRAMRGLSASAARRLNEHPPPGCDLADRTTTLQEATVAHGGETCPWLESYSDRPGVHCHVAVPLRSRAKVWGTMHLACPDPACFAPAHLSLLTAIGRQIGMAIENVRLAEAQQHEALRRQLLDQVMRAQEDERKRVARELHDELAQNLAVLIRDLERAGGPAPIGKDQLQARIRDTRTLALRILRQTRRLIFDLRPTALDDLGLLPAIRRYSQHHLAAAEIDHRIDVSGEVRRLPSQIETAVFRIAQEAITNVVRHSFASAVHLALRFDARRVALTVVDDGKGFDLRTVLESGEGSGGMGLLGMRERAELLGGQLEIKTGPGEGTTVHVEIPIEGNGHEEVME